MNTEPELKQLKYTSKLSGTSLVIWIKKNNFPKGFQILCHNCNQTKGYYGKCPHEIMYLEQTFDKMTNQSNFEL